MSASTTPASAPASTTTTGCRSDRDGGFPHELYQALAAGGWLGIAMPRNTAARPGHHRSGGHDAAIARSGAGLSGASAVHMNIFGLQPVVVFGTMSRSAHAAAADRRQGQGLLRRHRAQHRPEHHQAQDKRRTPGRPLRAVNGQKVWISTAQVANKMLILARTTPAEDCKKPTEGLSLFYTDLDRQFVEVREIEKMGRKAVDSNQLFIDGLRIPVEDRIGEEGRASSTSCTA
jgi:acyl-CoA dehydrogenase